MKKEKGAQMIKKTLTLISLILLLPLLGACNTSTPDDPVAIVEKYFAYWNSEDIDGTMALIADEPEIEVDLGVYLADKEQIRATFEELFERSDFRIEVSDFEVDGNTVTYNYQIFVEGTLNEQGRSQAIVEDGKIKSERYIGQYTP